MLEPINPLFAATLQHALVVGGLIVVLLCLLLFLGVLFKFGSLWIQAYASDSDVSVMSLIGMSFRQIKPSTIIAAKVMGRQAGLSIDRQAGMSTARLESHYLAGGDVTRVIQAIVAAHRAGLELDFDRAALIDLAGRDVLDAVRTSVTPKVIDCPDPRFGGKTTLSAVARNGVELLVRARVTVRTNLDQLIGGSTEETIIARVGQGIITAIGSSRLHTDILAMPSLISKGLLERGLDANSAFEIVSIDIADIDIGENIGARLQTDQADADMRMAKANAEKRLADATARWQEMKANVTANRAMLLTAEAMIPVALSTALRAGKLRTTHPYRPQRDSPRSPRSAFSLPYLTTGPRLPFADQEGMH